MNVRERLTQTALNVALEYEPGHVSDFRPFAEHVLEELLPEITDPESLLQLPAGSLLLSSDGRGIVRMAHRTQPWVVADGGGYGASNGDLTEITERMFGHEGPLTLVWTP